MSDANRTIVLLRYSGEIHTKARATRKQFVKRLARNVRDALAGHDLEGEVHAARDRIRVELEPGADPSPLARVFGVQSLSTVEARCALDLGAIVQSGTSLFADRVRGLRFAVRARRVGGRERVPLRSREVEQALGAALLPHAAGVDLGAPEFTVRVELAEAGAYLFAEHTEAPGGLPIGVEGRGVSLLSGGFDSAVASWQLLRRGVALDYCFCNLGGDTHRLGVLRVAHLLAQRWHAGHRPVLVSLDFEPVVAELRRSAATRYWQILLKRWMLRAADAIARERRAVALVTGEAVGQVSSQTLQNLAVISRAAETLVLRPLAGANKQEIIATARAIGSFELSKVVGEYCAIVPSKPATGASFQEIEAQEARLDPAVLETALARRRVYDLRALADEDLALPELEVTGVPPGAVAVDLRPRRDYDAWHHPGALHLDFQQALRAWPGFDRENTYVLYCDYGLMSAHLAELMRKQGFQAFHVRGGTRTLRPA